MALSVRELTTPRSQYQPGDIVELVSGGPPMTVLDSCPSCGDVDVAYATPKGRVEILTLPSVTLELAA